LDRQNKSMETRVRTTHRIGSPPTRAGETIMGLTFQIRAQAITKTLVVLGRRSIWRHPLSASTNRVGACSSWWFEFFGGETAYFLTVG
jgi:hypothetical protein